MKRVLAMLMVLALLVAYVPTVVAGAATSGYYTYTVSGGKATITDCDESISGDITIPATLGGYPVTSIGNAAFYLCDSLTSITIPNSVTSLGNSVFYKCYNLESVTIPDGVTSMGYNVFFGCSSLHNVEIPDSVAGIGGAAFYGCSSLVSITIPSSSYWIGSEMFSGCSNLTCIKIPSSIIGISESGFTNCSSLTDVYYNGTLEQWNTIEIGSGNEALTNARIHTIDAVEPTLNWISVKTLPDKTEYWMGEGLDTTGLVLTAHYSDGSTEDITDGYHVDYFDSWMYGVQTVYVEYEGYRTAFNVTVIGVTGLSVKTLPDKTEYWMGEDLDTTGLTLVLHYSNGTTKDVTDGFYVGWFDPWMHGTQSVFVEYEGYSTSFDVTVISAIGLSVKTLPEKTEYFRGEYIDTKGLVLTVSYSNGTTKDVTDGFYIDWFDSYMTGVQMVNVSYEGMLTSFEVTVINGGYCGDNLQWVMDEYAGVLTISGNGAIYDYNDAWREWSHNIYSVVIEEGVTQIGNHTFSGCYNLNTITIPESVTYIGFGAFESCWGLYKVNYNGTTDQKSRIYIEEYNEYFTNAAWYCAKVAEYEKDGMQTQWESLEEALANAAGGTVRLLRNMTAATVAVKPGVTLDLNGYTLTAELVVAMKGAVIRDGGTACTGGGLLKISQSALVYAPSEGSQIIPVWNGRDGYIFTKVTIQQLTQPTGDESTARYMFLPSFSNQEAAALLSNGGTDNGLKFKVCMTWNGGKSQLFYTYEDSLVSMVYDGTGRLAFDLSITGIAGITDIVLNAEVATDTGAIAASAGIKA